MFKQIALSAALLTLFGTAHAYQAEVGATIAYVDPDDADSATGVAVDGTYFKAKK